MHLGISGRTHTHTHTDTHTHAHKHTHSNFRMCQCWSPCSRLVANWKDPNKNGSYGAQLEHSMPEGLRNQIVDCEKLVGAPACPHLPGPQLPPQQVHWPGSKNIEKGQLDRHRRITVIITIIITIFGSISRGEWQILRFDSSPYCEHWWGPPPAPTCLAPSSRRSRCTGQAPKT